MIGRRTLLGAALALAASRPARAGTRINLLVGSAAGAPPDQAARAFAPFLERHLPHIRLAIVNLPGDAGLAAFRALADASPDGGTLGWLSTPTLPARSVDRPGAETLPARLRLLGSVSREPITFVSSPDAELPLTTAQDLVRFSAENATAVPLATPPAGSPPHLAALRLQAMVGTRLNIVTFPSAAAARQAALSHHVAAAVLGLGDAIEALRAGTLTGLGIAAKTRADAFPDMPLLRESGLKFSAVIRRGLAAPAALPAELGASIASALQAVTADPEFRAQADSAGFVVAWLDGAGWTSQTAADRTDLAALWRSEPWLASAGG